MIKFLSSSCKNCVINVGKWTLQMLIPQYLVLVLKLSPIYMVSINTVFLIPQNQCYPGTSCIMTLVLSIKSKTFFISPFWVSFSLELKKPILQLSLRMHLHGILCSRDAIQIFLDFLLGAHSPPIFCEHCAPTATMQ